MERSQSGTELNWKPLEKAVPPSLLGAFMHMGEVGTIQQYKHRDTRRYLYIDSDCTRFYDLLDVGEALDFVEIDRSAALRYALETASCEDWDPLSDPPQEELTAPIQDVVTDGSRAARLLEAFLTFQCAVEWAVLDDLDGWEILLVFTSLNYEMRGLAGLLTGQVTGFTGISIDGGARRIQEALRVAEVPTAWLSQPEEGDASLAAIVRAWRTFCEVAAAETGDAPSYGVPRSDERSLTEEPSRAEADVELELPQEVVPVPREPALLCSPHTAQEYRGYWGRLRKKLGL